MRGCADADRRGDAEGDHRGGVLPAVPVRRVRVLRVLPVRGVGGCDDAVFVVLRRGRVLRPVIA